MTILYTIRNLLTDNKENEGKFVTKVGNWVSLIFSLISKTVFFSILIKKSLKKLSLFIYIYF